MITARYQVLQYMPYARSGEWVAVGLLVYSAAAQQLEFLSASRLDRASALFPWADTDALKNIFLPKLRSHARLDVLAGHKAGEFAFGQIPEQLSSLSAKLIPTNDNALQWGEERLARGESFSWICEYLENAYFNRHHKVNAGAPSDEEV